MKTDQGRVFHEKPDIITFENVIYGPAFYSRREKMLQVHKWDHTLSVVSYVKMILRSLPNNGIDYEAIAAAYWHDVGRKKDIKDERHSQRGARMANEVLSVKFPFLDIDSVVYTIQHHSNARPEKGLYPTIENMNIPENINPLVSACLWDADRLDLLREPDYCKMIDINFLSTDFAKEYANSPEHRSRYGLPPIQ